MSDCRLRTGVCMDDYLPNVDPRRINVIIGVQTAANQTKTVVLSA